MVDSTEATEVKTAAPEFITVLKSKMVAIHKLVQKARHPEVEYSPSLKKMQRDTIIRLLMDLETIQSEVACVLYGIDAQPGETGHSDQSASDQLSDSPDKGQAMPPELDDITWALVDPTAAIHRVRGTEGEVATLRDFAVALHGLCEGLALILINKGIISRDELLEMQTAVINRATEAAKERRRVREE